LLFQAFDGGAGEVDFGAENLLELPVDLSLDVKHSRMQHRTIQVGEMGKAAGLRSKRVGTVATAEVDAEMVGLAIIPDEDFDLGRERY
jgi:hypothetical protein